MDASRPHRVLPATQRHPQVTSNLEHGPEIQVALYGPNFVQHGQELPRSDHAPLAGPQKGFAAFARNGKVIAAKSGSHELLSYTYNHNNHATHSHGTWDRANAAVHISDQALGHRPPPGFEIRPGNGQLANSEPPIAGRQALSLDDRPGIRPPPGLGFTPRSRPTQPEITRRPPPGLGFTPRSRPVQRAKGPPPGLDFSSNFERLAPGANRELSFEARLRLCLCQCCPNGHHRPAPGPVQPQNDEPQRIPFRLGVQSVLDSDPDFHDLFPRASDLPEIDSLRSSNKFSTATPEERRLARKAGREAMRREMVIEDDEAVQARKKGYFNGNMGAIPFNLPSRV